MQKHWGHCTQRWACSLTQNPQRQATSVNSNLAPSAPALSSHLVQTCSWSCMSVNLRSSTSTQRMNQSTSLSTTSNCWWTRSHRSYQGVRRSCVPTPLCATSWKSRLITVTLSGPARCAKCRRMSCDIIIYRDLQDVPKGVLRVIRQCPFGCNFVSTCKICPKHVLKHHHFNCTFVNTSRPQRRIVT